MNRLPPDPLATRAMRRADVWRIATMLIEQFGRDASRVATACASALGEMGDAELAGLWMRVDQSIAELQKNPTETSELLN